MKNKSDFIPSLKRFLSSQGVRDFQIRMVSAEFEDESIVKPVIKVRAVDDRGITRRFNIEDGDL